MRKKVEADLVRRCENFVSGICGLLTIKVNDESFMCNTWEYPIKKAMLPDGNHTLHRIMNGKELIQFGRALPNSKTFYSDLGPRIQDWLDLNMIDPRKVTVNVRTEITNNITDLIID